MFFPEPLELKVNGLLLFLAERNHAQGPVRMLLNVFPHQRDNPLCLGDIHVFGSGIIHTLLHIDKFNARVRFVFIAAGEGDQLIMVNLLV